MYAPGRTPAGAGDGVSCPRQANFVHGAATQEATQSAIELPRTRTVRHWLGYARPSRTPQGYAGVDR